MRNITERITERDDKLLRFIKKLIQLDCYVRTDYSDWYLTYKEYRVKVSYNVGSSVFVNDFWQGHISVQMIDLIHNYHSKYEDIDLDDISKDIDRDIRKKKLDRLREL